MQRHSASEAAAAEALRALHVQLDQQASAVVNIRDSAQRVIQDMVGAVCLDTFWCLHHAQDVQ